MKKFIYTICLLVLTLLVVSLITDKTYLIKALRVTYLRGNSDATIYDYKVQATKKIKSNKAQPWELDEQYNVIGLSDSIEELHKNLGTIAFLIIKDGKILTEKYYREGSEEHLSGIWSMTKTYTSLLILKAVEDGLISSVDDPVTKYIPEWDIEQDETLTLRHLASMSAGLYWEERDHSPFALITKLNFYNDLEKFTLKDMYAIGTPGEIQHYNSGGTQVLGTVLNRVLGEKSIAEYLTEKFWQPLGYQYDGLFILDSKHCANEKTFGGIVSVARDVSRLGQLLLNDGEWNGEKILSKSDMQLIKEVPYHNTTYSYGLWTGLYNNSRYYYQAGFRGQYCISFPEYNLVITRLGHHDTPRADIEMESIDTRSYIKEALRIVEESGRQQLQDTIISDKKTLSKAVN